MGYTLGMRNLAATVAARGPLALAVPAIAAAIWTSTACGEDAATFEPADDAAAPVPTSTTTGTGAPTPGAPPDAGAPRDGGDGDGGVPGATAPNLKVAFIGDTAAGADFRAVLALVRRENAQLLLVQGDLTYAGDNAADWFPVVDDGINKAHPGSKALVTIPYFVARGNHDVDWGNLGRGLRDRMAEWGVTAEDNDPTLRNYSVVYKGLKMVFVDEVETEAPTRAEYVTERLENDPHLWKICSWHKNMRNSNVGPKADEMGWDIYERCRRHGAIVAQGHSHTYSRSKTLVADQALTVDPACADPFSLCVGPGKHFFFDSSLGGVDTRPLNATVANRPHFASKYTGNYGALFVEFHVDGDPRKARGYFKTVGDVVVDPPASSGRTTFDVTLTP